MPRPTWNDRWASIGSEAYVRRQSRSSMWVSQGTADECKGCVGFRKCLMSREQLIMEIQLLTTLGPEAHPLLHAIFVPSPRLPNVFH